MEAVKQKESEPKVGTSNLETSRTLKRNIENVAVNGKINEHPFKSPPRKEIRISHENMLRLEFEQWKELIKDNGIRSSVSINDGLTSETIDVETLLKQDQKNFIQKVINAPKMMQESNLFRKQMSFLLKERKMNLDMKIGKASEALDMARKNSIKYDRQFMHIDNFHRLNLED